MASSPIAVDSSIRGIRIEVFDEASPVRLRVHSASELAGWTPFVSDPTHEGSRQVAATIQYRGGLYAITRHARVPSGWQYELIPWPAGEMVRRTIVLSQETRRQAQAEKRMDQEQRRRDRVARSLGLLIAFLPAPIQERISEEYDYDAPGWTKINSLVVGIISAAFVIYNDILKPFAGIYGALQSHSLIAWPGELLSPYLLIDSLLRFGTAVAGDKPLGLLPLEFLYWLIRQAWPNVDRCIERVCQKHPGRS